MTFLLAPPLQFVEAISNKQGELDNYIAEGYKNALSEERRRYCFLVDRQCAVAKNNSAYHSKVRGEAAAAAAAAGHKCNNSLKISEISFSYCVAASLIPFQTNMLNQHERVLIAESLSAQCTIPDEN